jgi:hypothetical protein
MADLANSTRRVEKTTYQPVTTSKPLPATGRAIVKSGFVSSLALQPGEVAQARAALGKSIKLADNSWSTLTSLEGAPLPSLVPSPSEFAGMPTGALRAFGRQITAQRKARLSANKQEATATATDRTAILNAVNSAQLATDNFEQAIAYTPIGMLNLERLEMEPAGVERGDLVASIPLAPLEKSTVIQKEWSVINQEFTSIVADSETDYSEKGVTDATDVSQAIDNETEHSKQFNVNATVSGHTGFVTATVSAGANVNEQVKSSEKDSRNHAVTTTRKASALSRQSHKTTISVSTVTGTSETTVHQLQNPSTTNPMRIDYFNIMRMWHVSLYRYGLRLTYDIAIPEPGAAMREAYAQLAELQKQASGAFVFPYAYSDISEDPPTGQPDKPPLYLQLAAQYTIRRERDAPARS